MANETLLKKDTKKAVQKDSGRAPAAGKANKTTKPAPAASKAKKRPVVSKLAYKQKKNQTPAVAPVNGSAKEFSALKYMHGGAEFYKSFSFVQKLNSQAFLCIDIDGDKMRYLSGKKSGSKIHVTDWGIKMTPSEEGDRFKALKIALDNIRATKYKNGQELYVCFFSPDVTIKQLVIPLVRKQRDFENAIFYKLQSELPNFGEKSAWRYQKLEEFTEENVKKARVLTLVCPEDVITEYMELFEEADMQPQGLIPRQVALSNMFRHFVSKSDEEVLVDVSYDITHVSYLNNGVLEYARNIASGAANLEMAIHENKGNLLGPDNSAVSEKDGIGRDGALKPEKIRAVLKTRLKILQNNQNPALQLFRSELQNSIDYFNNLKKGRNISRVFVTGYGVQKESLISFLKKNFGLPVFILAPKLENKEEARSRQGEFGAALGSVVERDNPFNMVPGEIRKQAQYKRLNYVAGLIFALLIGTMGYMSYFTSGQVGQLENRFEQIKSQFAKINPAQVEYQNINNSINEIRKRRNALQNHISQPTPMIDVLRLLSNETPERIVLDEVTFSRYQFVERRGRRMGRKPVKNNGPSYDYAITISGMVNGDYLNSDVVLINFIDHLKSLNYFKNVEIDDKNKRNVRQRLEFEIKAYL